MGTLVVVGTGINVGQMTTEAHDWLEQADKVLYCITDAATERLILKLNPNSESLYHYYGEGKRRNETYEEMVTRTMECLKDNELVVVAYYGHPGFFVYPSHKAIMLARAEGHEAMMLPGVSSFDCLIADLGVNVACGCQIFEATDLMIRQRYIDVNSNVVILQVASLGDVKYSFSGFDQRHLGSLREYLLNIYPADFVVTAYYASQFSVGKPRATELKISELTLSEVGSIATLYIPPLFSAPIHLKRLKEYELDTILLEGKNLVPLNSRQPEEQLSDL
jgi:precorrin-2 methylase